MLLTYENKMPQKCNVFNVLHNKIIHLFLVDINLISEIKDTIDCSGVSVKLLKKIKINKAIIVIEDTHELLWINKLKDINAKDVFIIDILFNLSRSKNSLILKSRLKFALGPFNRMYFRRELYRDDYLLLFNDLIYIARRAIDLLLRICFTKSFNLEDRNQRSNRSYI